MSAIREQYPPCGEWKWLVDFLERNDIDYMLFYFVSGARRTVAVCVDESLDDPVFSIDTGELI